MDLADTAFDCAEHAESQQVDLEKASIGTGILVPLADRASCHCCRLQWHQFAEWSVRDNHAARVLREMARQPTDLTTERNQESQTRVVGAFTQSWHAA